MVTKPTKFDKATFLKKLNSYLKSSTDAPEIVRDGKGKQIIHFMVNLPTIPDFCSYIGITKKTLYNWRDWETTSNEKEDGSAVWKQARKIAVDTAFERILNEQQKRLINRGLSGDYNPTIVKLILSNNHNMHDEVNTNVTGEVSIIFDENQSRRIAERITGRK